MLFQIILASFVSGLLSAMGFGSGTVLILWLTTQLSYSQLQAQGVNLMFFIPCALLSLIILAKRGLVDKKEALPLGISGAVGLIIGHFTLPMIPAELLSKLFGIFVILLALLQLFNTKKRTKGGTS